MRIRLFLVSITAFFLSLGFGYLLAEAMNPVLKKPALYKYYTGLQIERGESLWEIAGLYADPECISREDYIAEIKLINRMTSDTIHSGQYLTIFYYSEEFK